MNNKNVSRRNEPMLQKNQKEGSALIVALGVLVLMVLMGLVLTQVSSMGRSTTAAWVDSVQARMLAQSGLESTIDRDLTTQDSRYLGEDWNGDYSVSILPSATYNGKSEEVNGNNNGTFEQNSSPKYALRPSFFADRNNDGNPDLISVEDENGNVKYRGYSGELPSSYGGGHDTYSIKVTDNSTKINVNSLNENMAKVIDNLYQVIYRKRTGSTTTRTPGTDVIIGKPVNPGNYPIVNKKDTDGNGTPDTVTSIVCRTTKRDEIKVDMEENKITGGYGGVREIQDKLEAEYGVQTGGEMFDWLEEYLVVDDNTWLDWSVVHPKPQERTAPGRTKILSGDNIVWMDENGNINGDSPYPYDFRFRTQPRAPVNLNRAEDVVLVSLIEGLKARVFEIRGTEYWNFNPQFHFQEVGPITRAEAVSVVEEIKDYRAGKFQINFRGQKEDAPFESWAEFEEFIDQRVIYGGAGLPISKGYLLKAHFNPNTRPGKFNNNSNAIWSWFHPLENSTMTVDKTDFTYYSTEFTLHGGGYFEVESYGRITDRDNRIRAEATVSAVVKKFNIARHTTQRDFEVNRSGKARVATYPENTVNTNINDIEDGVKTGSNVSGMIAMSTIEDAGSGHHEWHFSTQDEVDRPSKMDPNLSYPLQVREYNDVDKDGTDEEKGLMGGYFDSAEKGGTYPFSAQDPSNYSDFTPDGLLMASDRYRFIRFSTEEGPYAFPQNNWKKGYVEFWWKPRQNMEDLGAKGNNYNLVLYDQWFLAEKVRMRHQYLEPAYHTGEMTWMMISPDKTETIWKTRTFPDFIESMVGKNLGDAAGYYISLTYSSGPYGKDQEKDYSDFDGPVNSTRKGFRVRTEFVTAFDEMGGSTWVNSPRTDIDDKDMVPATVRAEIPFNASTPEIVKPKPGKWMHIVLKWEPETFNKEFFWKEWYDIKVLVPHLYVNGVKETQVDVYAGNHKDIGMTSYLLNPPFTLTHNDNLLAHWFWGWPMGWHWSYDKFYVDEYGNLGWIGNKFLKTTGSRYKYNVKYWDKSAEGTIDEAYISEHPSDANGGKGSTPVRYFRDGSYTGKISRQETSIWGADLKSSNDYATLDQRVFLTDKNYPIEIIKVSTTQYRPKEDFDGSPIPPSDRPYFSLNLRAEGGSWNTVAGSWYGDIATPKDIFGSDIEIPDGSNYLEYRLTARKMNRTSGNVTPFFEDITVLYRRKDQSSRVKEIYFTYPDE